MHFFKLKIHIKFPRIEKLFYYHSGKRWVMLCYFYSIMLFIMGLPVFQIILFCLSIGKDPVGLPMAIVNHEIGYGNRNCTYKPTTLLEQICDEAISSTNPADCPRPTCVVNRLSCQYLEFLDKKKQKLVSTEDLV